MVSPDHYILWSTGCLYHTKVKLDPSDMFSVVCVFIDHASDYTVWVYNRISGIHSRLSANEICARSMFEPVLENLRNSHGLGYYMYFRTKFT